MTKEELIDFEEDIASAFAAKQIRAPIHLDNGNEEQLIEIFKTIRPQDWVCGSWRQHYHCLLKGVPKDELKAAILEGRSIGLCFAKHRIVSSAIVGGIIPIALGIAWAIRRTSENSHVYCFVGDTTAETGIFHECGKYAYNFKLPITFVIEDNNKSVCTNTREVWNSPIPFYPKQKKLVKYGNMIQYYYESRWPHAGHGERIQF